MGERALMTAHPSRLVSRSFGLLLVGTLGGFLNLQLLFAVVPLYTTTGGAGTVGAGLVTGALMATTVLTQPQVPKLTSTIGYPATLAIGLVLLGVPALLLPLSPGLPLVLGVSLARGLGFGTITVTGSALTAELVPTERHGAGMGLYGIAVGVPGIVGLPLGVWLAHHVGYTVVFLAAGIAPLAALPATLGIRAPRPAASARHQSVFAVLAGLGTARLARPFFVLTAATAAIGIVKTFLPLAVPAGLGSVASAALFALLVTATLARLLSGVIGDRVGTGRLLVPGILIGAVGLLGLVRTDDPTILVTGTALFGLGLGVIQTVTLVLMLGRVSRAGYGSVSAQWNIAFDAGTGAGAAAFGVVVGQVGYETGFAITAGVLFAATGLALRDRLAVLRADIRQPDGPPSRSRDDSTSDG